MALDRKYGVIPIPGIPMDEPVFVIRAQDKAATDTIQDYGQNAMDEGATMEFIQGVIATHRPDSVWGTFVRWQEENEDKVKVPD